MPDQKGLTHGDFRVPHASAEGAGVYRVITNSYPGATLYRAGIPDKIPPYDESWRCHPPGF